MKLMTSRPRYITHDTSRTRRFRRTGFLNSTERAFFTLCCHVGKWQRSYARVSVETTPASSERAFWISTGRAWQRYWVRTKA